MTNYKLLLPFISKEWYTFEVTIQFHLIYYNMINSIWTRKIIILYYFWLFRIAYLELLLKFII